MPPLQFSLKMVLGSFLLFGIFFALVRVSDVPSAFMFMLMVAWMLSPIALTFAVLYWRLHGGGGRKQHGRRR